VCVCLEDYVTIHHAVTDMTVHRSYDEQLCTVYNDLLVFTRLEGLRESNKKTDLS
jgi:hypothetical protein